MMQRWRTTGVIVGIGAVVCVLLGILTAMGYSLLTLVIIAAVAGLLFVHKKGPELSLIDTTIVLIVCGYVILNRGWSYVHIQLGPIPLYPGEVTIMLGIISLMTKLSERPRPTQRTAVVWLIPMVLVAVVHMAWDVTQTGLVAIQNFSLVYTVILIPCGYYMALNRLRARRVLQLFGAAMVVQLLYTTLFPWRRLTQAWSFEISDGVPFFGGYAGCYLFNIAMMFFAILIAPRLYGWKPVWTRLTVLWGIVVLLMVQSRGGLLSGVVCMAVLIAVGRRHFARQALAAFATLLVGFVVLGTLGLQLKGDRAQVNMGTLTTLVRSIVDGALEDEVSHHADLQPMNRARVRGMTGSRNIRLKWWKDLIDENLKTVPTAVFGKGFAHVLITDKLGTGFMVRHPHNVYVTVFARLGFVGCLSFMLYLFVLLFQFLRAARSAATPEGENRDVLLFFVMLMVVCLSVGITAPLYESPYFAVPLYFLFGFGSGLLELHRRGEWTDNLLVSPESAPSSGKDQVAPE